MIQISADRQRARCVRSANERITTGLTGKAVTFRFGAGWENVTARTAVFEGSGVTRDCLIENGEATIPHECLTVPGGVLRCGVYGVEGDKKTPTVYAELGQIERGADPSGDTSTDPTLAVWAQILARMGSLDDLTTEAKNTLVAAINEAAQTGGGGGTVTEAEIEKALGYKPIGANDVPVKKVNGATGEVKSTFYVTVTPTGNGYAATADKTAAEVYAAYVAGYAVYAIVNFPEPGVDVPFELPLVAAARVGDAVMLGFSALGSLSPTSAPMYPTVAYSGNWLAWIGTLAKLEDIPTIPTALKNPKALVIKIGDTTTSYDGSAAKTVEIPNNAPDVLLCTISGAGTSASPFTCDKTTAQIYEAAQVGKQVYMVSGGIFLSLSFVDEHMARFTKVTSVDTLDGMQGYATLITVQSNGKVSVKQTGLEQTSNRVNAISASSTNTQYPGAKAVWDAIPHPEAKTDAMTQAVGKDVDGKLWTAPGGGGSSSGIELVYTWTADGTTMSAINDLTISPGKLYFCETIVPSNGDLTANVTVPLVNVRIGSEGNTYTGMMVGTVTGQYKYSVIQSRWTFFVLGGTIHSVSDRTQNSQNVPQNAAYKANKIYIYSATSDVNIISGTTVNIYKMG